MPLELVISRIKDQISEKDKDMARLIASGYTVTIRPTKDGIKITSHKEKVV